MKHKQAIVPALPRFTFSHFHNMVLCPAVGRCMVLTSHLLPEGGAGGARMEHIWSKWNDMTLKWLWHYGSIMDPTSIMKWHWNGSNIYYGSLKWHRNDSIYYRSNCHAMYYITPVLEQLRQLQGGSLSVHRRGHGIIELIIIHFGERIESPDKFGGCAKAMGDPRHIKSPGVSKCFNTKTY